MKKEVELLISGMHCQTCSKTIEQTLISQPDIEKARVDYSSGKARICYESDRLNTDQIIEMIIKTGYRAQLWEHSPEALRKRRQTQIAFYFKTFLFSALFSLPFFVMMILSLLGYHLHLPALWQFICASLVQFGPGWIFYRGSYYALKNHRSNMDLLIALGTTAAYSLSLAFYLTGNTRTLYFETSAIIITLVLLGKWLESLSIGRASGAVEKLLQLQPKTAQVERAGKWEEISIKEIQKNDLILVRSGERIPVDGIVENGESWVDESMLSGESLPVYKSTGNKIYSGTVNQSHSLTIKALKIGLDTVLSSIAQAVEKAQASKAPIQRVADTLSAYFVPFVLLISFLTGFGWFFIGHANFTQSVINAIAVIVIACPCGLGLAVPVVIMVASERGAHYGILFKEVAALEKAQALNVLLFDKTATLTTGQLSVQEIHATHNLSKEGIINIAASLEQHSLHPLGKAIVRYAKTQNILIDQVQNFITLTGQGLSGIIREKHYTIGSYALAQESGIKMDPSFILNNSGELYVFLWHDKTLLGYIQLSDQLRESSKKTVQELKNRGIQTVILTGDRAAVSQRIADQIGIEEVRSEILPERKAKEVALFKTQGKVVGMVGDGVNDAPALAESDVSFALGMGSDIAIEAADITLMNNDPISVVHAIDLSRVTLRKIKQNLFLAFIYNFLSIPLAVMGILDPIIAAGAMAMSSVSVVANALLLKYWVPK